VVQIQAALTDVPQNVGCIRFTTVAGTRTLQQTFDVTAGGSGMTLPIQGLPYSQSLTISAEAFAGGCSALTTSTPATYFSPAQAVAMLVPGETRTVAFVLKPTSNVNGSVDFLYLTLAPASRNFGSVVVGQQSAFVFTVMNIGAAPTTPLAASIITMPTGSQAQFSIGTTTCNTVLPAGQSCTVQVRFIPTTSGAKTATLQVTAAQGGTVTAALTGTGQNPARLVISPGGQNFGSVPVTATSATTDFTVSNAAGSSIDQATGAISVTLQSSDFFITSNLCANTSLPGGASCHILVAFVPGTLGLRSATLAVTASPGGSVSAPLSGMGTPPLTVMPTSFDFFSTPVGMAGSTAMFTFTNNGGALSPLLTLTSSPSSVFRVMTDGCGARTLTPLTSCTVTVQFFPQAPAGAVTGSLTLAGPTGSVWSAMTSMQGTGI
jgi:hypothetical protein